MHVLHQYVCRAAERMVGAAFVSGLALVVLAVCLYVSDRSALGAEARLHAARSAVATKLDDAQRRVDQLSVELAAQQEQVMRSEKVMRELRQLKSTWDWFGANAAQQRTNRERLDQMEAWHAQAVARRVELQQEQRRVTWEQDGHRIEAERLDDQLRAIADEKAGSSYHLARAWRWARSWLLLAVALYVLGPVLIPAVRNRRRRRAMPVG